MQRRRLFYTLGFEYREPDARSDPVVPFRIGAQLIGFELDPRVLHQYRARFTDDLSGTNLRNCARLEADNPDSFAAMYRFWIQKPLC
jgi:hypothetical protein